MEARRRWLDAPKGATVHDVKKQIFEHWQLRYDMTEVHIFAPGVEEQLPGDVVVSSIDFTGQEKPTLFAILKVLSTEELKELRLVLEQKHEVALPALQALMWQQHASEKKRLDDLIREMGA